MRALLIEDDSLFGSGLQRYLREAGFVADWLQDSKSALMILNENEYFDLVIVDVDVGGICWKDWVATLKSQQPDVSVIVMSSEHAMTRNLDISGAHHLPKRFLSRKRFTNFIWSVLHRGSDKDLSTTLLSCRNITLDVKAHEVKMGGEFVNLSRREFALLHKLLSCVGQVVSREDLMQSLYGWDKEIDSNTLEVHIHNLRQKLKADFIKSIRGLGYKIIKDSD